MAIRRAPRGTGITKRDVLTITSDSTPQDILDTLQAAAEVDSFEGQIRGVEDAADNFLKDAKYDAFNIISDADPHVRSRLQLTAVNEVDSHIHFALQIKTAIIRVRGAIKRGDADQAARYAINLGELITAHDMKVEHEPEALAGHKQRSDLQTGRTKLSRRRSVKDKQKWLRWNSAAAGIWRRQPALSKNAVAKLVNTELKLNEKVQTIARRLKKPCKR